MGRLLDRLGRLRKRFTQATPHAIHDVLCVTRLTSLWIRFSFEYIAWRRSTSSARTLSQSDKRESYVVRRIGDQTIFSEALEIFLDAIFFFCRQKRKRRSLERRSPSLKAETSQAIALMRAA
jgi:hypothetical protein